MEDKNVFIDHFETLLSDLQELSECKKFISIILPPWMWAEKTQLNIEVDILELRTKLLAKDIEKIKEGL